MKFEKLDVGNTLRICSWPKEAAETYMQQNAGCVSDEDGLKCPEFESLLEYI